MVFSAKRTMRKLPLAGNAFIAFAVVQRDHLQVAALRIGMSGALRERDLEHARRGRARTNTRRSVPSGVGRLRVHHRAAAAEGAEFAGADGRELPGAQCLAAQLEHAARGGGRHLQRQRGQQRREHHGESHAPAPARMREPAPQACAAVISLSWYRRPSASTMPSSRPTGMTSGQVLHGAEQDELEHHAARVLALGRAL